MDVRYHTGHLSKVVMLRVLPGTDIIEGIQEVCQKLEIKTGSITCLIGSLQRASLLIAVPMENKIGAGYSKPRSFPGPLELISAQGMIGQQKEGDIFIHLHGLISDKGGDVHGGHLIKGENPVLITCEVMISKVEGARMVRTYDTEVDMEVLMPSGSGRNK